MYRKLGQSSKRPPPANTGKQGMVHILHFIEQFYPLVVVKGSEIEIVFHRQ